MLASGRRPKYPRLTAFRTFLRAWRVHWRVYLREGIGPFWVWQMSRYYTDRLYGKRMNQSG